MFASTSHLPLRLPFSLRISPFSCISTVRLLIVLSDFPVSYAIFFCVADGSDCNTFNIAISSSVIFIVSFWLFESGALAL